MYGCVVCVCQCCVCVCIVNGTCNVPLRLWAMVDSLFSAHVLTSILVINPRRACAGWLRYLSCLSVCLSVMPSGYILHTRESVDSNLPCVRAFHKINTGYAVTSLATLHCIRLATKHDAIFTALST